MVDKALLPSIHDLIPTERGGRKNRKGIIYQDHIGAAFCLDMLQYNNIKMIYFENEDDIDIIRNDEGAEKVEFVQVKHLSLDSHWSISTLCTKQNGSSILQKSLRHSRCKEETSFRIVTSVDVKPELSILKYHFNTKERLSEKEAYAALAQVIAGHHENRDIRSEDDCTIEKWVERCFWDKQPDDVESISAINTLRLEEILAEKGYIAYVARDQRDEIYASLLSLVSRASSADIIKNPGIDVITKESIEEWLYRKARKQSLLDAESDTLIEKMDRANLHDYVDSALELRLRYSRAKFAYKKDFLQLSSVEEVEGDAIAALNGEKARIDLGIVTNGLESHARCVLKLQDLSQQIPCVKLGITDKYLQGFMYDRTSRCLHRYDEAQP